MSFYRATLTGQKPFSSFTVPGTNPSVVVGRRGALLDAETTKKLRAALRTDRIPNVSADDVAIVEVEGPGKTAPDDAASDDVDALRERVAELEDELAAAGDGEADGLRDRVETLTAENEDLRASADEATAARDEAEAKLEAATSERDALRTQLEGSDAASFATGILGSLTVPELTKLAKARGAEHPSSATKDEIISAVVGHAPGE